MGNVVIGYANSHLQAALIKPLNLLLKTFTTKTLRHEVTKKTFLINPLCLCALVFLVVYVSG